MTTEAPREKTAWQAATEVERQLHEAAHRGDRKDYLRVLAGADLFLYVAKGSVDAGRAPSWTTCQDASGRWCVAVRTVGERPPRRAESVALRCSLHALARAWPDRRFALLVNPGTPTEMRLPAGFLGRRAWKRATAGQASQDGRTARLLTTSAGPVRGPLARALACGAHLSVTNGVLWNDLGDVYDDYEQDTELLRRLWGTTTARDWQEQVDALLEARNSPPEPEFVLGVRRELAEYAGGPVTAEIWRRACSEVLRELDAPARAERAVGTLIGRILRYEARFRADGLLPPDGTVRSAEAYDYGRAVNFARWGLSARLCPGHAAREAVLRAGELSAERYASWADFSAGYALGRVLRFDTEEFGEWYTDVLTAHRTLLSRPDSPWVTLPWPRPEPAG